MSKLLLCLICLGLIIIVYGGNDSIDLELRLAVGNSTPTSEPISPINDASPIQTDINLDNNPSKAIKPNRKGRKKSIVPIAGAERQRMRRKLIQERVSIKGNLVKEENEIV
jgi:hypothetical protein